MDLVRKFSIFFFSKISKENVFYDILEKSKLL